MSRFIKIIFAGVVATSSLMTTGTAFAAGEATETTNDQAATLRLAGDDKKAADDKAAKIAKSLADKAMAKKLATEQAEAEAQKIADALAAEKAAADAAEKAAQKAADDAKLVAEKAAAAAAAAQQAEIEKFVADKIAADKAAADAKAAAEQAAADQQAEIEKFVADKIAADKAAEQAEIAAKNAAIDQAAADQIAEIEKFVADKIAADQADITAFNQDNPLGAQYYQKHAFMAYAAFPEIAFNPIKPVKNPLTVYKLRNIVHNLPLLDGLTRLKIQKLAKGNSVIDGVKVWRAERKYLERTLILNNYKSFWFDKNHTLDLAKAQEVIATIKNAESFALQSSRYNLSALEALIDGSSATIQKAWLETSGSRETFNQIINEDEALNDLALNHAKLELALTHIAFAYSRHASAGLLIPSAVDRSYDVHPVATASDKILASIKSFSQTGDLQNWLEAQNPQSTQFNALLAEFKKQSGMDDKPEEPIVVPNGKSLKKGNKSKRVIKLAMRLEQLGYYKKATDAAYPQIVNTEIIASVKAYQTSKGLKVDGIAGPATIGAMNYKRPDYLKTLLVNLERQRWMPHNLGSKHVLVNQPEFRLRIFENNEVTHAARVVIGKNKHQTPMFFNTIRTVVVNPYWNIPSSILYNEMKNKINNDPTYLARNGYQVVGNINWENATSRHVPFRVRQKPGSRNALGRVKFLFPNRHSIYLHDTPSKSLFKRSSRAFSHGCVRVQNPELLALNLMGWSKKQFNSLVRAGKNRHFALKKKVPVYLVYMTAFANEDGEMRYFRDIYSRDGAVARALGVKQILQKIADKKQAAAGTQLSQNTAELQVN